MGLPISFLNMMMMMMCLLFPDLKIVVGASTTEYTTLIYKECAKQEFSDPSGLYSQALTTFFGSLVSQSTKTKYYKTTTGTGTTTITGFFQCRGDLSNDDCYKCVRRLPVLSSKLCGKTFASRVQLSGCYFLYEVAAFSRISGMLSKTCGKSKNAGTRFKERRDKAFRMMQNRVVSRHGFYATTYDSVHVLGQCQGDVGDTDCSACVKNALEKAQVECGNAISGQIYLHKCFIAYSYYPNGAPRRSSSSFSPGSSSSDPTSLTGTTGKTVAIAVGAIAGVGFLVTCLLYAKKKHDDS